MMKRNGVKLIRHRRPDQLRACAAWRGCHCGSDLLGRSPPNVAVKLETKRSVSAESTLTWVVSYCGPTATKALSADAAKGVEKKAVRTTVSSSLLSWKSA